MAIGCAAKACRPKTCRIVMTRSARPPPSKPTVQLKKTEVLSLLHPADTLCACLLRLMAPEASLKSAQALSISLRDADWEADWVLAAPARARTAASEITSLRIFMFVGRFAGDALLSGVSIRPVLRRRRYVLGCPEEYVQLALSREGTSRL